jgi:hypothetical protein
MPGIVYRRMIWHIATIKEKRWRKRIKVLNGKKVREAESFIKANTKFNYNRRWCDIEFNALKINGFQKRW